MILDKLLAPYKGLRKELYVIFISRTVNAFGLMIFPFMTLLLNTKIGMSTATTGLVVAVTGVLHAPASLIGGKISDKYGRKKVLIIFECIAAVLYALCSLIEPTLMMVYIIMAASFSFGVARPSHDAMIADLTDPEERQGAYSLSYLGFNLGFAFAQIIAGFLFRNHLPLMFLIDAGTAAAGITMIFLFVPETHKPENINSNPQTMADSKVPIIKVLLKKPVLLYFALASFGYRFVYSQWQFLIPIHAEHNFPGAGAKLYGMLGSVNAFYVVFFTPLLTSLFSGKSNLDRIIYAGFLFSFGFGMLGFYSTETAFFIAVIIFTTGEILEAISNMPFIMNHTPATHRGRVSSLLPILMGTGYTLGPVVIGSVLEATSFMVSWVLAGSVVFIAALGMVVIRKYDASIPSKSE